MVHTPYAASGKKTLDLNTVAYVNMIKPYMNLFSEFVVESWTISEDDVQMACIWASLPKNAKSINAFKFAENSINKVLSQFGDILISRSDDKDSYILQLYYQKQDSPY
jgi:hypothetical protein|tara:strand:- start:60663 stop:60986 length:324 start_codon:yes stop_codon:yes gene_type:complete